MVEIDSFIRKQEYLMELQELMKDKSPDFCDGVKVGIKWLKDFFDEVLKEVM